MSTKQILLLLGGAFLLAISNPDSRDFEKSLKAWYYCKWPVDDVRFLSTINRNDLVLFSIYKIDLDAERRASFLGIAGMFFPIENHTGIGGNNCY